MALRIKALLEAQGLRTAILGLDDFYLPREARLVLAREVHPLLATRGVPGTHDIALLQATVDALQSAENPVEVPQFDKSRDERVDPVIQGGTVDIILLEGWCVGARPQDDRALVSPANSLEATDDADMRWRRWVNRRLQTDYSALFDRLDLTIFLRAPDFKVVAGWRSQQERDLSIPLMDDSELVRFVAHFERITRAMLDGDCADLVIDLDEQRVPVAVRQ